MGIHWHVASFAFLTHWWRRVCVFEWKVFIPSLGPPVASSHVYSPLWTLSQWNESDAPSWVVAFEKMEGCAALHLKHIGIRGEAWRRCRKASVAFYATCRCAVTCTTQVTSILLSASTSITALLTMSRIKQRWTSWRRCGGSSHGYVVRQQQQKLNLRN